MSPQAPALDAGQVERYRVEGYLSPLPVLSADDVRRYRACFERLERSVDPAALPRERARALTGTHTRLPWVHELVSHPHVLDAVECLLGPDLLVWNASWFAKAPGDASYISWHQDGTYWGLHPPEVCTAWIALTASDDGNGCVRVAPRSHREPLPHVETYADDNALSRGQEIAVRVDEAAARSLVLAPGEMSVHHIGLAHGSRPNRSADRARIGLAVRYIAPGVRQDGDAGSAMLVRGEDRHGHFRLLDPPVAARPPAAT